MTIKSDKWIRRMAEQHGMIEPFEPGQVREVQGQKLAHFGLGALVDAVLCVEDVPAAKPDARASHAACAVLNVTPAQAVMVGDSWE